jgi:hypothetical protein
MLAQPFCHEVDKYLPDYTVSYLTSCVCIVFQNHDKGKQLLEHVCQQLNLIEKDYFGLRHVDHTRQRVGSFLICALR